MSGGDRIHFSGALYHVISRGNNKANIFIDSQDYNVFLKQLREVKQSKDFLLYCYCLMPNHFHLLLEVDRHPLSKIMQSALTAYVMYFNSKYNRVGHLFQSRYKAIICEKEEYLLRLVKYIHLNPMRAKIVKNINDYEWSSHKSYIGEVKNKNISIEKLFRYMGGNYLDGYKTYINILSENFPDKLKEDFKKAYKNCILGSDDFIDSFKKEDNNKKFVKIKTSQQKPDLSEILDQILLELKITGSKKLILSDSQSRELNKIRKLFAFESVVKYFYEAKEIANFLNKDVTSIYKYLKGQTLKDWKD